MGWFCEFFIRWLRKNFPVIIVAGRCRKQFAAQDNLES